MSDREDELMEEKYNCSPTHNSSHYALVKSIRADMQREFKEWGESHCPHPTLSYYFANTAIKRTCKACWEEALKSGTFKAEGRSDSKEGE